MDLFLIDHLQEGLNLLNAEESFHCVKTTRHRVGDQVWLTDGRGKIGEGILTLPDTKSASIQINQIHLQPPPQPSIVLGVAPLKNDSRFEWLIEKAVELGVTQIQPVITQRTEKVHLKPDRLERIITAAMKQSVKAWRPALAPPCPLEAVQPIQFEQVLVAHCNEGSKVSLTEIPKASTVLLLIGPEGDFTPEEVQKVLQWGAMEVSLGPHRLRTETAAIAGLSVLVMGHSLPKP